MWRSKQTLGAHFTPLILALLRCHSSATLTVTESVTLGPAKPFFNTSLWINNLDRDLFLEGFIIIAERYRLTTTNGVASHVIAGFYEPGYKNGYQEGVGEVAKFSAIKGLAQINVTTVVVSDDYNHCVRSVDRLSQQTRPFVGRCGSSGKTDGFVNEALLNNPFGLVLYNNSLYIADRSNDALRMMDLSTGYVTTIVSSQSNLKFPQFLTMSDESSILVSKLESGISKVDIHTGAVSVLTPSRLGFMDGKQEEAMFCTAQAIVKLDQDKALIADKYNRRLRLFDLSNQSVSTVCPSSSCYMQTDMVTALLLVNDTLYVGGALTLTTHQLIRPGTYVGADQNEFHEITESVIMISLMTFSLLGMTGFLWLMCKRKKQETQARDIEQPFLGTANREYSEPTYTGLSTDLLLKVAPLRIQPQDLSMEDCIGEGFFGYVFKGKLRNPTSAAVQTVAIKSFKDCGRSLRSQEAFLTEATMMADLQHKNILSLIGIVWEKGHTPLVVLPHMENGDLHSLIRRTDLNFTVIELLRFAYQIACGMEYLEEQRFVHRDLAARNCMVSADYVVKIGDFGLSRDIYECGFYKTNTRQKPIPVRWMAIESITEGTFSTKSDVWSFAITLWEIITRGSTPYTAIENCHIESYLLSGHRLAKPQFCPSIVYDLMRLCWLPEPKKRLSFAEIRMNLSQIIETEPSNKNGQTENSVSSAWQVARDNET